MLQPIIHEIDGMAYTLSPTNKSWPKGITSLVISDGITKLESSAFAYATALESVVFPNTLVDIGYDAFYGCTSLTQVHLPDSVNMEIWEGAAFAGCTNLHTINIPNTQTAVASNLLKGCTSITSITLPPSVTRLKGGCFNGTSLTSIDLTNVRFIESGVFSMVVTLSELIFPEGITEIANSVCRGPYNNTGPDALTKISIPSTVTLWANQSFQDRINLTEVRIANGPTKLGDDAFKGCKSLMSFDIPPSLTDLGYGNFTGSPRTTVVIPNGVTRIGNLSGMPNCTTIDLPASLTNLTNVNVFANNPALTSVTVRASTPPAVFTSGAGSLGSFPAGANIYVPAASVAAYKAATGWSTVASKIFAI